MQVAEQYALMPLNAARLAVVDSGLIGTASSALVSSTHLYHAVALMRRLLGVGREGATVRAQTFAAELVDPITPAGWTHDTSAKPATTTLAWVDFGGDRMGRYDFTDNQWWNPLRPDHLVVRGSAGEIWDETVVRMADEVTPMTSRLERAGTGTGMNYEGLDLTHVSLDGRVVWRNAFEGARLSDDDLAVAQLLAQTGAWVRGGRASLPSRRGLSRPPGRPRDRRGRGVGWQRPRRAGRLELTAMTTTAPYGSWVSPITADLLTTSGWACRT